MMELLNGLVTPRRHLHCHFHSHCQSFPTPWHDRDLSKRPPLLFLISFSHYLSSPSFLMFSLSPFPQSLCLPFIPLYSIPSSFCSYSLHSSSSLLCASYLHHITPLLLISPAPPLPPLNPAPGNVSGKEDINTANGEETGVMLKKMINIKMKEWKKLEL